MANCAHLWQLERAFRISKTDLRVRPIYHRARRRIEAHICISFCAYKIYKELRRQLEKKQPTFTVEKAIEITKSIFAINLSNPASGETSKIPIIKPEEQKRILEIFEIKWKNLST